MNYGGRVAGTTLQYADHAMMARAFGLHAERITYSGRLRGALENAFVNAAALLDVVVTRDALSSDAARVSVGAGPAGVDSVGRREKARRPAAAS